MPSHYVSERRLSRAFKILGKTAVASLLKNKLPRTKQLRSGDLGEILATEYISEKTNYVAPIKRLRWKDHRDMAMRGDDVIGIAENGDGSALRFLKAEAKSRKNLDNRTVTEARRSLDRDNGLPSTLSLCFIAERLLETGNEALSDTITEAHLGTGIRPQQVEHMLFVFSGNTPDTHLENDLRRYTGIIPQIAVGLQVKTHQEFIEHVFNKVLNK